MYRPNFHFSPPQGWTNDPNGLVWHNGLWHLFYQHNPTKPNWDKAMHWGHAVSRDLMHWEHWPIALYPDPLGGIFSGCAVVNLREGLPDEFVACFTHDAENSQAQSLAFSYDEGKTWEKYAKNPILTSERRDFRDPKIFRHNDRWLMIVAAGFEAQFYTSDDLIDWTMISTFPAPQPDWCWECPDLIEVDGRWVLIASFIKPTTVLMEVYSSHYWIGDFDGKTFTPEGELHPLSFGPDDYAAVSWCNAPNARKVIIGWMSYPAYSNSTPTADEGWRGAMTLPRELSLENGTLKMRPVQEVEARRGAKTDFDEKGISLKGESYEIETTIDLTRLNEATVGFRLRVGQEDATHVFYDTKTRELCMSRIQSGLVDFHDSFAGEFRVPLEIIDGVLNLRIFVDRCSVEVFAQGGQQYGAMLIYPLSQSLGIEFYGEGARILHGSIYSFDDLCSTEDSTQA